MPVTLPPGRLRLATRPTFTGSDAFVNTIGTVGHRFGRERRGGAPPCVTITATSRPTKSATSADSRSD